MKHFIAISFTLKNQSFDKIIPSLESISDSFPGGKDGTPVLVHGFMPRSVVIEKGFGTEVVDALDRLFPNQMNCYTNQPDRQRMVDVIQATAGRVFVIGACVDGVQEEVEMYTAAGVPVFFLDLDDYKYNASFITAGERAVGVNFIHEDVEIYNQGTKANKLCACAIDHMMLLKDKSTSGEYKALSTIAIRKLQDAQMQMIKAITWRD